MRSSHTIKKIEKRIAERASQQFPDTLRLFEDGISLLIDATTILESKDILLNPHTLEGASEAAGLRFISTLPMSIWCSFQSSLVGNYGISKHILRLALEETIKLGYYVTYPNQALLQITRDSTNDHVSLGDMLKKLDPDNSRGLLKLHSHLSKLYSHANLNLPNELIVKKEDGSVQLVGGPRYRPELFEPLARQLLILIANGIKYILYRFPLLLENIEWVTRAKEFLEAIIKSKEIQIPEIDVGES